VIKCGESQLGITSMSDIDSSSQSPCIRNCCLDDDLTCLGCFRSLEEIKEWGLSIIIASYHSAKRQAPERSVPDAGRSLARGVQGAGERCADGARLKRLHEQLADAGGECSLCQDRAAISTHQYDGNSCAAGATGSRARSSESGHDVIGDDDVERAGRCLECGECGVAIRNGTGS